jgi:hypothetical protein
LPVALHLCADDWLYAIAGLQLDRTEVVGRRVGEAGHGYNGVAVPAGATGAVLPSRRGRIRKGVCP